jgi:2-hydroxycyclohexanecarboxyl-CoA dehydrogenase
VSRVAVVTGGASGMGQSICEHLARRGDRVAVLDVNGAGAEGVAKALSAEGSTAMASEVDVTLRSSIDTAMERVRAEFGPIEILVTSAGITTFTPFAEITRELWDRILTVNLTGTFECVQAAIPDMVAAGWGRIVTIASSSAQSGSPRMAPYVASKGGVIALSKSLAREYARSGITVNTIPPSIIDTPMLRQAREDGHIPSAEVTAAGIPVGRLGTGDDIAAACAFLCSDAASYITGQVIGVNGGSVV